MNTINRLTAHRPTDATLDELWSPTERAATLDRILADPRPLRFTPRRRRTLIVSVGVAAALAIAVPLAVPRSGPGGASAAAAAELDRLATVAAHAPFDTAGPGQFLHTVVVSHQPRFVPQNGGEVQPRDDRRNESWTATDGTVWRKDTDSATPDTDYMKFPAGVVKDEFWNPSFLATLPTDPDKLQDYLRHRAGKDVDQDIEVFKSVGDMLRGGIAPQALRVAAIKVLKRTPKVSLGGATTDSLGRPALEFVLLDDQAGRPGVVVHDALFFSTQTAEILEETESEGGSKLLYTESTTKSEIVDSVPDDVLDQATTITS